MTKIPKKEIIFDPSKENSPLRDHTVVKTEMDFLRSEQSGDKKIWVYGQICGYVKNLYRSRNWASVTFKELKSPREELHKKFGVNVKNLSPDLIEKLTSVSNNENVGTLGELLSELNNDNFWANNPSVKHAAEWLIKDVDESLNDLIAFQQEQWAETIETAVLKEIYICSISERANWLKKWLFDRNTQEALGTFPLVLNALFFDIIKNQIGQQLRSTKGAAVLELPRKTVNHEAYAEIITDYFLHNPENLTSNYLSYMSPLLEREQRDTLQKLITFNSIEALPADADYETATKWAANLYLPFRAASLNNLGLHSQTAKADILAESYVAWLLNNYPGLTNYDTGHSPINIRTHHKVKELLQNYWVLWVVVDGLNYIDHQKLLKILGKQARVEINEDYLLFAVLPTITKRAKYGLTVGKFASVNEEIEEDPQKYFSAAFPNGIYAGDTGVDKLEQGLKSETPTVCYWNYSEIDKAFHKHSNLAAANHNVEALLLGLANNINYLVNNARDPKRVAVVVCSDHGQMLRSCKKVNIEKKDVFTHGRTALGTINDDHKNSDKHYVICSETETVFLNPKSFRLHEETTLCLNTGYFADKRNNNETIGVHGGLFPEETLVGLAVLFREAKNKSLNVTVSGTGETGKSGIIQLLVDNPNNAQVKPLMLEIKGLNIIQQEGIFNAVVLAQQNIIIEIPIEEFPAQQQNNEFLIDGILYYEFEDGLQKEVTVTGRLICKTLYSVKNPSLRDRFKK